MESCTIVNRCCIKTAVTTLHNQLQSANMATSMVKRQLFYKVCVCKLPTLTVLLTLANQLVFVLLVHLFVCFAARVCFCRFSLPLDVEGWLRFVIVAYPGPFY